MRLANFGLGHGGVDGGAGYTYFDLKTGYEFSTVVGLTYNARNPHTDIRSGIDAHIDWGASKFLWKDLHVGLVGYHFPAAYRRMRLSPMGASRMSLSFAATAA